LSVLLIQRNQDSLVRFHLAPNSLAAIAAVLTASFR